MSARLGVQHRVVRVTDSGRELVYQLSTARALGPVQVLELGQPRYRRSPFRVIDHRHRLRQDPTPRGVSNLNVQRAITAACP